MVNAVSLRLYAMSRTAADRSAGFHEDVMAGKRRAFYPQCPYEIPRTLDCTSHTARRDHDKITPPSCYLFTTADTPTVWLPCRIPPSYHAAQRPCPSDVVGPPPPSPRHRAHLRLHARVWQPRGRAEPAWRRVLHVLVHRAGCRGRRTSPLPCAHVLSLTYLDTARCRTTTHACRTRRTTRRSSSIPTRR